MKVGKPNEKRRCTNINCQILVITQLCRVNMGRQVQDRRRKHTERIKLDKAARNGGSPTALNFGNQSKFPKQMKAVNETKSDHILSPYI